MNKLAWKNVTSFGWPLAILMAVAVFPLTAVGADRVVLGEYFNALW